MKLTFRRRESLRALVALLRVAATRETVRAAFSKYFDHGIACRRRYTGSCNARRFASDRLASSCAPRQAALNHSPGSVPARLRD